MSRFRALASGFLFFSACVVADEPLIDGFGDEVEIESTEQELTVCPTGPTVIGIDVSYYQENINWGSVKNAGVKFAFIRVSDGSTFLDPKFSQNWAGAKANGIIRGAYQFFRPNQDPIAQANLLLSTMGPLEPGDLPPVIDVEATGGLSPSTVAARVGQWINHVEAAIGRKPIIYTGKYFWQDNVQSSAFSSYPLWHAQYTTNQCPNIADQWSNWAFFQYTDSGSVAGVPGPVDTNRFNGDLAALQAFAGGTTTSCGDGTCNGGETSASCPADCGAPAGACDPIAQSAIIDETDDCFTPGGPAQYLRSVTNDGYEGLLWTGTTTSSSAINYGEWALEFAQAGTYRLEIYTDTTYATATKARYRVVHNGKSDYVTLNQKSANGFRVLGDFTFAAGGNQRIYVGDNTGEANTKLVLDAIRVTRLGSAGGCGDGVCGSGEGAETCQSDCQPCAVILTQTQTIDDDHACFTAGGPAEYLRSETGQGFDGGLLWTNSVTGSTEFNFADWKLFFAESGKYQVQVYTDVDFARSAQAKYKITHNGVTETISLSQKAANGWRTLGTFQFAAGGGQKIHLGDNTGESGVKVAFDALRITKVVNANLVEDAEKLEADGELDNTITACTVNSANPSSAALALFALMLVGLVLIRRRA